MITRFGAKLPLVAGSLVFSWGIALANGTACGSSSFRQIFEEGLESTDLRVPDPRLRELGESVVPCLRDIAQSGIGRPRIAACAADADRCRVAALRSLGEIGSPTSKVILAEYLKGSRRARPLSAAILWSGNLRVGEARPPLIKLLRHPDEHLRGLSVIALGKIGNRTDFDAMLKATLSLSSPSELLNAVSGLELLGDPRAVEPLRKRAATLDDAPRRKELERMISNMESQAKTPRP